MSVTIEGSGGVTTNSGAVYDSLQAGTAVTASGTAVNFTGIPSWVERITVMLNGVSTNGTSPLLVQLGISSGVETSGYAGTTTFSYTGVAVATLSSGFNFALSTLDTATAVRHGSICFTKITGNVWSGSGGVCTTSTPSTATVFGTKSLAGVLDRVRITTVGGANTFDAGTINIIYE